MNSPKRTPIKDATGYQGVIQDAWNRFRSLATEQRQTALIGDLAPAIHRFELGLFRLVVMGEIKKGKSSFINALLGQPDLLPTASDVATSTVFKVMYGPQKRLKVFFLPDIDTNRRVEPREIQTEELRGYGTEDGNKGNVRRVDFIGIELPHPLLKRGLVIVDTPGVGGLYKAHRDITWRYAPNADAICFVLDSVESVISNDEMSFLKELTRKVTRKIFFVQTKTDAVGSEQWRAWEKRNCEHLTKHLHLPPEQLLYFPVSAKDKLEADKLNEAGDAEEALEDLAASGFPRAQKFLDQGLMRQKEALMARQIAAQLQKACGALDRETREHLRIAQAQSKTELDKIADELSEAEKALTAWERETYPKEMRRFQEGFAELRSRLATELSVALDAVTPVVNMINQLHISHPTAKTLNEHAGALQQEMLSRASEAALRIERDFNQQAVKLTEETAERLAKGFHLTPLRGGVGVVPWAPIQVAETLHMKFTPFEKVQRGMMGLGVGIGLASVLTIIFPPAAVIGGILAALGGGLGGYESLKQLEDQKRSEAISKIQQKLTETMMQANKQAQRRFGEMAAQLEKFAHDSFEGATTRARGDLQSRLKDVQAARARTGQEAQARTKDLQLRAARLSELGMILTTLRQIQPSPAGV